LRRREGLVPGLEGVLRRLRTSRHPKAWLVAAALAVVLVAAGLWLLLRTLQVAPDPVWERITETGILRVCTDPSWPPFEFIDPASGRIEGFDADLARLLAERLAPGVRARFVAVSFDSLYDALLSDRCDLALAALPYEPLRTEDVSYSVAYFNAGLVLVTRADEADIEGLDDLTGRVVGVEWGFVPEGDSRQRQFLQRLGARRYKTPEDVLRALQSGQVQAALVDRISALAYLRDCQGLRLVGQPLTDVNYVMPIHPDSFRLVEEVNRVLLEMRQDGTLESLQAKWF
jgi:ABC-type amino acid transport substrate-binding protein